MDCNIEFNFEKKKYKDYFKELYQAKYLKKYIEKEFSSQYKTILLQYNFVSEATQIQINQEFLSHNYNTDIITFNLCESITDESIQGEMYISLKQIKKNASRYKVSFELEIMRVLIHGYLHLIGFNDKSKDEKKIMKKQEKFFLKYLQKKVSRGTCNN